MNKVLDIQFLTQWRGRSQNRKQFLLVQDYPGETMLFRTLHTLNKPGPVPDKGTIQFHQLVGNTFHRDILPLFGRLS